MISITELGEAVGLAPDLPSDLDATISVLFKYRNNVLHDGIEWPPETCRNFAKAIVEKKWPPQWFDTWNEGDNVTACFITDSYVGHCLKND